MIPFNHFDRDVVSQKNKSRLYFNRTRDDNENENEDQRPGTEDSGIYLRSSVSLPRSIFLRGVWNTVN